MSINERKDKTGRIKEVELGLNEQEQQALAECRRLVEATELDDLRDATLARYLRAKSWQVEPAIQQMKEYLQWRKSNNIDNILADTNFPSRDLIRTIAPYAYHNMDKEGRPIYIQKTGRIAVGALVDEKILNQEHFFHSHIWGVEYLQRKMHEHSLERGERVNGITTILDFDGLGFHHRNCLHVLKKCLDFDQKYYPDYVAKLYVINSPWVTPYLFTAVQVFLDEVTKSRIQVVSGNPAEFLLQHITPENLPAEYGGVCTGEKCCRGGMGLNHPTIKGCVDVLDSSQLKAEEVSGLDHIEVAYDFEKEVSATSGGANETFTWYFEVENGYDIDFSVELLPVSGQREADETKRVLIQKVERLKSGKGSFKAPFPNAKVIFRWDNNFSYFTSKQLKYTVSCLNDDSGKLDSLLTNSSVKPVAQEQKSA